MIRRAAELYATEADADERLSEDEVLRIAAELGIPAHHARQALYELPRQPDSGSLADQMYGPARIGISRAILSETNLTLSRLSEYLTTREYLRPLRRQSGRMWLVPADDTISNLARAFSRPSSRHHLAHARVAVTVRPLQPGHCHVRLDLDLRPKRRGGIRNGLVLGGLAGVGVGTVAFLAASGASAELAWPLGAWDWAAGAVAAGTAFTATIGASIAATAARFRRRVAAARLEVDGLLDRLERGEHLQPPPAPWRRRLQLSLRQRRVAG